MLAPLVAMAGLGQRELSLMARRRSYGREWFPVQEAIAGFAAEQQCLTDPSRGDADDGGFTDA